MSTIRDALDTLAEKVGAGADASNAFTIADKIDAITAAVSTPSNSKDIADAVEKFGDAMPTYEAEYDLLTAEPADWSTKYYNYFYKDGSDYLSVTLVDRYDVTTEEPSDWETNYGDYFTKSGDVYSPVEGETSSNLVTIYDSGSSHAINSDGRILSGTPGYVVYTGSVNGETEYTVSVSSTTARTIRIAEYNASDELISFLYESSGQSESELNMTVTTSANATTIKMQTSNDASTVSVTTLEAPTWVSSTYYSYFGKVVPTFVTNTYYKKDSWQ